MTNSNNPGSKRKLPEFKIALNYIKLAFRSVLLTAALGVYVHTFVSTGEANLFGDSLHKPVVLSAIWIIFTVEMILRFFPSRFENMGCQKQFAQNFVATEHTVPKKQSALSVIAIALAWLALNGIIGILFASDVIGSDELVLISLVFSVCDVICILFFCPFQAWFMKNKCCTTCRIYNWDYAMMFTPLVFIDNFFARSLLFFGVVLLIRWELTAFFHPERFSDSTNRSLTCAECTEKLCRHKRKLAKLFDRKQTD